MSSTTVDSTIVNAKKMQEKDMANESHKWVYLFSADKNDGNKEMKPLLGGKGANLAEMCGLKLPVPPGFTVTTEACLLYEKENQSIPEFIRSQVLSAIQYIESLTGKKFGDSQNPLLFSVRSGAQASMPGMMDTILNLGINDSTVVAIAKNTGNERFAYDSYRRFIQMYANVVMNFNVSLLEATLEDLKEARRVHNDTDLTTDDLKQLVTIYKKIILEESGSSFPTDPMEQLWNAIAAVFRSWNNARAIKYREIYHIPHSWGTAVNIQSMVFGNMGNESATGVAFTRDPSTGEKKFFGEYLINAQGEDVVAGIRTPAPINLFSKNDSNKTLSTLEEIMPLAYQELVSIYKKLEAHYQDMQDIEFTIEKNKLYILQTRNAKRTTAAAIRVAVNLVEEKIITKEQALLRIAPEDLNQLLHPRLDPKATKKVIAKGLPASPGAGAGKIVFTSEMAHKLKETGHKVILVRQETSPEDIQGMISSEGILTARGGMTSHAAVVARGMGKPCVAGCGNLIIDLQKKTLTIDNHCYTESDSITIDGSTGEVFLGVIPTIDAAISNEFAEFMSWAQEFKRLGIRTNADTPEDAEVAVKFGAEGIGLCRTEHMFFEKSRILAVREMIFASNLKERELALTKILPFQRQDFIEIFKVLNGHPVNIRLLDPPLHEFLPNNEQDRQELASSLGKTLAEIVQRGDDLHEFNPMLGHRGCRLGVTFPEIYRMQVRAIIEAAIQVQESGIVVLPEIMIPLVALEGELTLLKKEAEQEIQLIFSEQQKEIKYKIGTMIELPRAAILAGTIAKHAAFFSFGTNDLTQTTYGLSRDDAGKFLPEYINKNLLSCDPFVTLDQDGVGFLIKHANVEGKKANPNLHIGICGEHGGEPKSIHFCHKIGLDYVSCSPYRVPVARLAAAQIAIQEKNNLKNNLNAIH